MAMMTMMMMMMMLNVDDDRDAGRMAAMVMVLMLLLGSIYHKALPALGASVATDPLQIMGRQFRPPGATPVNWLLPWTTGWLLADTSPGRCWAPP